MMNGYITMFEWIKNVGRMTGIIVRIFEKWIWARL